MYIPDKPIAVGHNGRRISTKPGVEPRIHVSCMSIFWSLVVEGLNNSAGTGVSSRRCRYGVGAWESQGQFIYGSSLWSQHDPGAWKTQRRRSNGSSHRGQRNWSCSMPGMGKGDHDDGLACHKRNIMTRSKRLSRRSGQVSGCGIWRLVIAGWDIRRSDHAGTGCESVKCKTGALKGPRPLSNALRAQC